MKIEINSELKQQFTTLHELLNHIIEEKKGKYLVEKVRLDSWILTYFEEEKLKEIELKDYFEIVIYLEEVEVFKTKTRMFFLESIDETEELLEPTSTAFKLYDLTRANILLEKLLGNLNSILAYLDTIERDESEEIFQLSLSALDRIVICQEKENYDEIGLIIKHEIKNILESCKKLF